MINKIKDSDPKALDILFSKYYLELCEFSFNFLKSIDLSEEAVADVFLNIWLKRGKIEIKSSVEACLFVSDWNQSLNYLKKKTNIIKLLELLIKRVFYLVFHLSTSSSLKICNMS